MTELKEEPQEIQTSTLYNGEVVIVFDPNKKRNRYTVTDKGQLIKPAPPSVTQITDLKDKSAPLMAWAVNCAIEICKQRIMPDQIHGAGFLEDVWKDAKANYRNIKKQSADVGNLAHNALERYFSLPPEEFAPPLAGTPVRARFDEALRWFNSHKVESVCREARVYSRKHGFTGTLDHLARVDDKLVLLDYKSSNHIYQTYIFQIAAYIMAREEETGENIEAAYILQIGENQTLPYIYDRKQLKTAFKAFLGLLQVYKCDKMLGKIKPQESDFVEAL